MVKVNKSFCSKMTNNNTHIQELIDTNNIDTKKAIKLILDKYIQSDMKTKNVMKVLDINLIQQKTLRHR